MYFLTDDSLQNMFFYQPALSTLQLQKYKGIDYIHTWKSKWLYNFTLSAKNNHFLHSIIFSCDKVRIKFEKDFLAVLQTNYATKIVNVYIVYELNTWPQNSLNNFTLKDCLFGATDIVKYSDKNKWIYSGYGIVFDESGFWSFGNNFARYAIFFDVDNNSPSHSDNLKNKKISKGICLSLHYNDDNSYLLVNEKEICRFKANKKMFQLNFV